MINKNKPAFTLIELMLSMVLFTVIGFSLYQMFNVMTVTQTKALGMNRLKTEGYQILDKLAQEVEQAVGGEYYLYHTGTPIQAYTYNTTPPVPDRLPYDMEFRCFNRVNSTSAGPLFYDPPYNANPEFPQPAKSNVQQLFFTRVEYQFSYTADKIIPWDNDPLSERIIYLDQNHTLTLCARTEHVASGDTNIVEGMADPANVNNFGTTKLADNIYNIEYLFWGNSNTDWDNYTTVTGDSNAPLTEWDSTVDFPSGADTSVHQIGELPKAMKIVLTLAYDRINDRVISLDNSYTDSPSDLLVFEKVILFKHKN
ncbi:MAG: prepilin-type N-terminal cleavage/methylation domain-containing protein [Candidatus Aureabacteria bacterium]|nr:prepilin-type N-terminal cleavage/methylation domain-containing protein [Candidatus Auribacterota bacterium]